MKTYPFSLGYAHSIEFYYNHVKNTLSDMESGEIPMNVERYDQLSDFLEEKLLPLYEAMFDSRDGRLVYLTGPQVSEDKEGK